MYEFTLNLDADALQRLAINDDYAIHALVYSLFDANDVGAAHHEGRLLYADKGFIGQRRVIFVRSPVPPVQARCAARGLSPLINKINYDFKTGSILQFGLIFNALTRSRIEKKRTTLRNEDAVLSIFNRKMPSIGLIPKITDHPTGGLSFHGARRIQVRYKTESQFPLDQFFICGVARISDPTLLERAFCHGVGRGRAFGCGLISGSLV